MPPKATSSAARGRGRPKAVADEAPKKLGRTTKAVAPVQSEPQPKKRGRPSKKHAEEPSAVIEEQLKTRGGRGRPRKEPEPEPQHIAEAPTPKKRAGRPRKTQGAVAAAETPSTPSRKGRASRNVGLDLSRVSGSPRVTKRASPRSKAGASKPTSTHRINPHVRSKLRTRAPPAAKKAAPAPAKAEPKKTRGRPRKNAAAASAPTKKTAERKTEGGRGIKSSRAVINEAVKPVAKPSAKPRKRRGYTNMEVPDKYVKQLEEHLRELMGAEAEAEQQAQAGVEAEAEEQEDVEMADNIGVNGVAVEVMEVLKEIDGEMQEVIASEQQEIDQGIDGAQDEMEEGQVEEVEEVEDDEVEEEVIELVQEVHMVSIPDDEAAGLVRPEVSGKLQDRPADGLDSQFDVSENAVPAPAPAPNANPADVLLTQILPASQG